MAASLLPLDMAVVVATVSGKESRGPGISAQFRRRARESKGGYKASLLLVDGSLGGLEREELTLESGEAVGPSTVYERRFSVPRCTDTPLEGSDGDTWKHHPHSHFTCKIMEGLCKAVESSHPRYVAVVSEESLFRWDAFLDGAPALPSTKLVFTRSIPIGEHRDGLPGHHYNPSHVGWYRLPTFNNSFVFSWDVAHTLCTLHRTGPMVFYGPPELWMGQVLVGLEMLNWVEDEGVLQLKDVLPECNKGITISGIKSLKDWELCKT